jgi:hypothetical protein
MMIEQKITFDDTLMPAAASLWSNSSPLIISLLAPSSLLHGKAKLALLLPSLLDATGCAFHSSHNNKESTALTNKVLATLWTSHKEA